MRNKIINFVKQALFIFALTQAILNPLLIVGGFYHTAAAQANIPFNANENTGFVPCGDKADNPCTIAHLFAGMIAIINYLIATAGFVAVAMIIYAGLKIVWARGNQSEMASAKGRLSGAVTGVVLVSVAFILVNALFSGSFSLGIKDGSLILTNPIEYIRRASVVSDGGTGNNSAGTEVKNISVCIDRNSGKISAMSNSTCSSPYVKTSSITGPEFCVYKSTSGTNKNLFEASTKSKTDCDKLKGKLYKLSDYATSK